MAAGSCMLGEHGLSRGLDRTPLCVWRSRERDERLVDEHTDDTLDGEELLSERVTDGCAPAVVGADAAGLGLFEHELDGVRIGR